MAVPSNDFSDSICSSVLGSTFDWLVFSGASPREALSLFVSSTDKDSDEPFFRGSGDGDLFSLTGIGIFKSLSGKGGGLIDFSFESPEVVLDLEFPREIP